MSFSQKKAQSQWVLLERRAESLFPLRFWPHLEPEFIEHFGSHHSPGPVLLCSL